ncbi:MAG: flagellar biosynthetic protein FliO [Pseudomonadota bacterium]
MNNLQIFKKIIMCLICSLNLTASGISYAAEEASVTTQEIKIPKEESNTINVTEKVKDEKIESKEIEILNIDKEQPRKENLTTSNSKATPDSKTKESLGMQTHDLMRSMASLILLMLLLFVGSWFLKKKFSLKPNGKNIIGLVSVMNMGNKEKIALLKVGSQNILVGITQQNIRTLYTYPVEEETKNSNVVNQQTAADASKEFSFIMDRATSKEEPEKKGKDDG